MVVLTISIMCSFREERDPGRNPPLRLLHDRGVNPPGSLAPPIVHAVYFTAYGIIYLELYIGYMLASSLFPQVGGQ